MFGVLGFGQDLSLRFRGAWGLGMLRVQGFRV